MDNMKFTGKNTPKGVRIPAPVLNINGFGGGESVELHAMKEAVVVLKQYMNAKELAWAIHGLQKLALELSLHLFEVCGKCEDCGDDCPVDDLDGEMIDLPDFLRDAANIPKNAKLCASVDAKEGTVLISQADYANGLRDLPEELVRELATTGLRMCELEDKLMRGEIIYGS